MQPPSMCDPLHGDVPAGSTVERVRPRFDDEVTVIMRADQDTSPGRLVEQLSGLSPLCTDGNGRCE